MNIFYSEIFLVLSEKILREIVVNIFFKVAFFALKNFEYLLSLFLFFIRIKNMYDNFPHQYFYEIYFHVFLISSLKTFKLNFFDSLFVVNFF